MGDGSGSGSGLMGDGGATGGTALSPAAERARGCAIAASYRASSSASAVFALQHIAFAPSDPRAMVAAVARTFLIGLMFAGLLLWRRRVVPLVVGHWLLDLLGLGLPLLLAALA